jgi:outer membrane protein TolC
VKFFRSLGVVLGLALTSAPARAVEPGEADGGTGASDEGFGEYAPAPVATIKPRSFTLAECLALAERNHPGVWAARARLAYVHGQLDEATFAPWFQWSATSNFGLLPPITGSVYFTASTQESRNISAFEGLRPVLTFDINGLVPLYTFGKITAARNAARANVRVTEWDMEKVRQVTRMDVRRAYFGLLMARDARFVIDDALSRLDKALQGIRDKLAKEDKSVTSIDRLRLETFREEVVARSGEPRRGESFALAALRFMTGIQTAFDVPDEPLKRPNRPLVGVTQYLTSARLFRPEIAMARAGIVARREMLDYTRARFFPDFGLGLGASYAIAPSATPQITAWTGDPFNHFYYYFGFGFRWSLDLLPNAARVSQAEAQLEETRALERLALGGIMVEVENAHASAVEAKVREEAWDRAERKAREWIATVQDMIDLGTRDEGALLEPLRSYGNSRVAHLFALMELNVAMSELARVSGWDASAPTGE